MDSDSISRSAAVTSAVAMCAMEVITPLANFGVVESLSVAGDAEATAQNIVDSASRFRFAAVGLAFVAVLDVIVAWGSTWRCAPSVRRSPSFRHGSAWSMPRYLQLRLLFIPISAAGLPTIDHDTQVSSLYTLSMDRSVLLAHLRRTRFAPGDRDRALSDARAIAAHLKCEYGARVIGIGSLFDPRKTFRRNSDIDLVVGGLPPEHFYGASAHAETMTSFALDIIPLESATSLVQERIREHGVEL